MRNIDISKDELFSDPLAVYDAIVSHTDEPRRSRLRGIRDRIACAYLRYYVHQPTLERLRPLGRRLGPREADDVRYCYTSSRSGGSAVHDRVYAKLFLLSYFCAYCGIFPATTLDHYLSKGGPRGFPELSVLPANLIPSCSRCNTPRGLCDRAGRRALIHPYFDVIRKDRLLKADVRVVVGVPEAEFRVDLSSCSDLVQAPVKLSSPRR